MLLGIFSETNEKEEEKRDLYEDSDETFTYIAGYTSNGFPFGVTWEEMEKIYPGYLEG